MASPYVYTFRRRLVMQLTMIAILAAMLGLAALVRNSRGSGSVIPLGPPVSIGVYQVAVPQGWPVTRNWLMDWPPTPRIEVLDPAGGRRLEVVQHLLAYSSTPEKYLETFHHTQELDPRPIVIAGQPGIAVEGVAVREGDSWTSVTWHQYAVTVNRDNLVLLLHMESRGRSLAPADRKLFSEVVASATRPAAAE